VRLEGLGQLKNPMTSGTEPATFRLVAQCLNQVRYYIGQIFQQANAKTTEDDAISLTEFWKKL
jgi:hypothetical protein